ncbi:MAG: hypothetical protein RIQ89_750 [Bacteroidota bacterium]|jgi:hypothetical protein
MDKSEYTLERVKADNIYKLGALYKNAFNINLTQDFIERKFFCNAMGKDTFAFIAVAKDGTVAAYYNTIPYVIEYEGKKILAAQSCVAMTHTDHRGKGLFPLLGKAVHDLTRDEGAKFIFGFPNELSYHGLVRKMNFDHFDTMKSYRIKVKALPVSKVLKKLGLKDHYMRFAAKQISKRAISNVTFKNSVCEEGVYGVTRDQNFINYKAYTGCVVIEIHGVKVWLKMEHVLIIGDMERTTRENFIKVIANLKSIAAKYGIVDIVFNVSPGSYYDLLMTELNYQFIEGLAILYWDFNSGVDFKKIKFTGADYDTF